MSGSEEVPEARFKKELLREKLAADVKAFLDAGGVIQQIPSGKSGGSDEFFRRLDRGQ